MFFKHPAFAAGARATLPVLPAPLGVRLAIAYLTADNVYGLMLNRFTEHSADAGKVEYFPW